MPLVALSNTEEYVFAEGQFDVRGWSVRTLVDDTMVGAVHDLLLDEQGEPRYLDVDLSLFGKHVLVPIGQARADRDRRVVWIPGFSRQQFEAIPAFEHEAAGLDPAYETSVVAAYASAYRGDHYQRPSYAGAVYGPSELEDRVVTIRPPRLAPLSLLPEFEVAEADPDPRGWRVFVADGREIGRVAELIIDTGAMKVRHLVCGIDESALGLPRQGRQVLIPVGHARLDVPNRTVLVDAVSSKQVARLPLYTGEEIGRELERDLLEGAADDGMLAEQRGRFYAHPRFSPREFFGPKPE